MKESINVKPAEINIHQYFKLKDDIETDYKNKLNTVKELNFTGKAKSDTIKMIEFIHNSNIENLNNIFKRGTPKDKT
tara:strand:+ start:713 stop:943 length:231 start_codon:yes stop_codon:yes gene_type:complete